MSKVTKPIAGVKHIKEDNYIELPTKDGRTIKLRINEKTTNDWAYPIVIQGI